MLPETRAYDGCLWHTMRTTIHGNTQTTKCANFARNFHITNFSSGFLCFLWKLVSFSFFPSFPAFLISAPLQNVRRSFGLPVFFRNGISFCFISRLGFLPEVRPRLSSSGCHSLWTKIILSLSTTLIKKLK